MTLTRMLVREGQGWEPSAQVECCEWTGSQGQEREEKAEGRVGALIWTGDRERQTQEPTEPEKNVVS